MKEGLFQSGFTDMGPAVCHPDSPPGQLVLLQLPKKSGPVGWALTLARHFQQALLGGLSQYISFKGTLNTQKFQPLPSGRAALGVAMLLKQNLPKEADQHFLPVRSPSGRRIYIAFLLR
jgi:hypothetical protein